jgi:hypothetical protein
MRDYVVYAVDKEKTITLVQLAFVEYLKEILMMAKP